jgi:hypothetical protein
MRASGEGNCEIVLGCCVCRHRTAISYRYELYGARKRSNSRPQQCCRHGWACSYGPGRSLGDIIIKLRQLSHNLAYAQADCAWRRETNRIVSNIP